MKTKIKKYFLRGDSITIDQIEWVAAQLIADVEKEKEKEKQDEKERIEKGK